VQDESQPLVRRQGIQHHQHGQANRVGQQRLLLRLLLASGLARTLYQAFLEMAAKDGRRRVRAVTAPVNSTSIAFHAAMGFTVTGPVGDYDGPDSAKMLFERRL
jgi:hypothetical protein